MRTPMAIKVERVRPQSERSITDRQYMAAVPISDLNAEIRRRRWAKWKHRLLTALTVVVAVALGVGLLLASLTLATWMTP